MKRPFGWTLETVRRPAGHQGFALLPCLWVVERAFDWLHCLRRLSKDFEGLCETTAS